MRGSGLQTLLPTVLALIPLGVQAAPALEVQVLGSGGPRPSAQASAGTLVLLDGVPRILVDAGQGTLLRAGEQKADLRALDVVLLTHLHVDHSVEVPAFVIARSLDASGPVRLRPVRAAGERAVSAHHRVVRQAVRKLG